VSKAVDVLLNEEVEIPESEIDAEGAQTLLQHLADKDMVHK
jgi:hypothetical protein